METRKNIFTMEDHDQAYYIWKRLGIKGATLVHIDAHIDLAWFNAASPRDLLKARTSEEFEALLGSVPVWNQSLDEKSHRPDIGNYICSAIRDGIVERMYWVAPDDFLDSDKKIRYWARRIKALVDRVPGGKVSAHVTGRTIKTSFSGKELVVCTLASLPDIAESVILDIDTDFFVTPHEANSQPALLYVNKQLPWIWPDELASILRKKNIKSMVSTIAYSVEGYYTPIEYKFIGDWMELILSGRDPEKMRAAELLKEAAISRHDGDRDKEIATLRLARELAPGYAAVHFIMSHALYDRKDLPSARRSYDRAISIDGSYRTRYNNTAGLFIYTRKLADTDTENGRMMILDPDNASVQMNLGERFLVRGNTMDAEKAFRKAMALDPRSVRARSALAGIMYMNRRYDEAVRLMNEVLKDDPAHLGARRILGSVAIKKRSYREALEHYRTMLRLGYCDPGLYAKLSSLFLLDGKVMKSLKYLWRSIVVRPLTVKWRLESFRQRIIFERMIARYGR